MLGYGVLLLVVGFCFIGGGILYAVGGLLAVGVGMWIHGGLCVPFGAYLVLEASA